MSQYGAYGAALAGLTWPKILGFYYPGTTIAPMAADTTIKVWVTVDDDDSLRVLPTPGLQVRDGSGHCFTVPTGSTYSSWRISRFGDGYHLTYRTSDGADHPVRTPLTGTTIWAFDNDLAHIIKVRMPSGSVREYRGSVRLHKRGTGAITVNQVKLEDYIKSVVAMEMPTSWAAEAVRSQAVAARSYAVRQRDVTDHDGYDICDTTACQVYGGLAVTDRGVRTVRETSGGNAATAATAGLVVRDRGVAALTQFAPSNGGHTAQGDNPYLSAHPDPYDGLITSQAWTRSLTTAQIAAAWPSVGSVTGLQVTARDGAGRWGGRVTMIKITGSRGMVTVSGNTFQYRFGMRSTLFTVTA